MIQLIGVDVDGTLVGASGIVAEVVWRAAQRARERGIRLALCSGRPAFGKALEYARTLDPDAWHIFQNGASVVHLRTGRSRSVSLPLDALQATIARARHTGELLELYTDHEYAVEVTPPWAYAHAQLLGVTLQPRPFETLTAPVVRAQWLLSPEASQAVLAQPHPAVDMSQSTSPIMSDTWFISLTAKGVNKGSAMRAIAEEHGISLQDTMYIGDAGNDLPALSVVGHPVATADASEDVKRVARYKVGSAEHGAVAEAIEIALDS